MINPRTVGKTEILIDTGASEQVFNDINLFETIEDISLV